MAVRDSWIVQLWADVFAVLSKVSLMRLIRFAAPKDRIDYRFIDSYVATHLALALTAMLVASIRRHEPATLLLDMATLYAAVRIFEITVYQVNVLLFDEFRAKLAGKDYAVRRYSSIVILLIHN